MNTGTQALSGAFLTARQVAGVLQLSEMTVLRLVERGLLACYRIGRRIRFQGADVDAFLARRRHGPDRHPHGGA